MTSLPLRHNFKWNINELLSLQREYQLLEMSIQDISAKHERTLVSILYRLQQEGFIESWIDARGYQEFSKTQKYLVGSLDCEINSYDYGEDNIQDKDDNNDSDYEEESEQDEEDDDYVDDEDEEEEDSISSLNQRVWTLETAVSDIKDMISTLLTKFSSPSKPLKKLRQPQHSVEI